MTLAAGTKLGSYQIVAPLGSGGMGEVYRARDAKLERDVAIKVLPAHLSADADALARFEREAKAVASLSHPNILAIHDFGTQDGVAYAVTELLEGETLRGKLDGAPIPQAQAVNWAQQIARGLSAAHSKGVIHRDLKPENVFVTKDGHVKILDFGLAKKAEQVSEQTNAPTGSGHTAPGTVMGTVGYMSPEQVRGLPVDHRSDIFSFGAILYELLSGRKAFKKDTATDTIASIIRDEPPELSQSGRSIPVALDHIVRHCLEKDRDHRFGTANDVAFALSEASGATSAVTSGSQIVAAAPAPRKSPLWIVAAVLAMAAVAAFLLLRRPHAGGAAAGGVKRVAVLPFENLGAAEDDYFADGIADQIRGKLASLPGVEVIARASSAPYKKTTKTPKQIADELNAGYLLTATVRWQKSGGASRVQVSPELVDVTHPDAPTTKWQQPFDANLTDVFQVQSDIASRVAQALGTTLGGGEDRRLSEKPTTDLAAYDAFLKGEAASNGLAVSDPLNLRKALAFYEQAVALDPSFAQAWARIGVECSLLHSNSTPTPELAERARQAAEKAIALAPVRPDGYLALSYYQRIVLRNPAAALEACAKALRLAPTDVVVLFAAAAAEQTAGQWDAALEHFRQADRLDPRSAGAVRRLANGLLLMRRYGESREAVDRALSLAPSNLAIIQTRAMTFLGEGDLGGARGSLASATSVDPAVLVAYMAQVWDLGWVLDERQTEVLLRLTAEAFDGDQGARNICLTQAYALRGDSENTRRYAEEARSAFEAQVHATPDDPQRHVFLGLSLAYLGRKDDAIREGRRSVELLPISRDAVAGAYMQHQLARIYILTGEPEKALDQLEPLLKVPYYLSPGWLKIDPNFDPIRNNPRFQKLVAGAK